MKYLAVDYGKKYIGLAVSDDMGLLAFPLDVYENNKDILNTIKKICQDKEIQNIVIGDSVDQDGIKNSIAKDAQKFADILKNEINLSIHFQKEQFTSVHARNSGSDKKGRIDASAAALILQRFLDRLNK